MPKTKIKCSTGWKKVNFHQGSGEVFGCERGDIRISVSELWKEKRNIRTGFARKLWLIQQTKDNRAVGRTERPSRVSAIRDAEATMNRLNRMEARRKVN